MDISHASRDGHYFGFENQIIISKAKSWFWFKIINILMILILFRLKSSKAYTFETIYCNIANDVSERGTFFDTIRQFFLYNATCLVELLKLNLSLNNSTLALNSYLKLWYPFNKYLKRYELKVFEIICVYKFGIRKI